LLTFRERQDPLISINTKASLLVAECKYAEAAESLVSIEAATRRIFHGDKAWRVPRFLMTLGKARAGLGQYAAAETNLLEAWDTIQNYGPTSKDARDCVHANINLYAAWNTAQPGKGYDAKATPWKQTLAELQTATND
jgi:hypothetical protein